MRPPRILGFRGKAAGYYYWGKFTFIECARLSDDPQVLSLVTRWDTLSHYDQRRMSIEELCEAVGLAPGKLLGKVVEAAFEFNSDVSNLIAAVMHPDVVQASINRALQPKGVEDRRIQFLHSGWLPTTRGSVVNGCVF